MTRSARQFLATIAAAALLAGCATMGDSAGWATLVDGAKGLDNFTRVGDANWTAVDGALQATQGGKDPAYLVSKQSYTNFQMRVEFWASDDANSGVFMRCQDRNVITDENCYEANIFDQRPDPTYGTGAIVKVAAVSPMPKAGAARNAPDERRCGGKMRYAFHFILLVQYTSYLRLIILQSVPYVDTTLAQSENNYVDGPVASTSDDARVWEQFETAHKRQFHNVIPDCKLYKLRPFT